MNDQLMRELGSLFDRADRNLFLVGGTVRDNMMGREPKDLDFATDALPDEVVKLLFGWSDAMWDQGKKFGTIAAIKDGVDIEITTFRTDGPGRKPEVTFTADLVDDLVRRDFTVNAMAQRVDADGLHDDVIDPFNGLGDITNVTLDTPRPPEESFSDDPLRMLRAARFVAVLGFDEHPRVRRAMKDLAENIKGISAERVMAEMDKLLVGEWGDDGLMLLHNTGLLSLILPELGCDWRWGGTFDGDVDTCWANLLADVNPNEVHARLKALKVSNERTQRISSLVAWVQRFSHGEWQDWSPRTIRHMLAVAGPEMDRLCKLLPDGGVLADEVAHLIAREGSPKPPLTGKEIMLATGMPAGPLVGEAMQMLWAVVLEDGPLTHDEAVDVLQDWIEGGKA